MQFFLFAIYHFKQDKQKDTKHFVHIKYSTSNNVMSAAKSIKTRALRLKAQRPTADLLAFAK